MIRKRAAALPPLLILFLASGAAPAQEAPQQPQPQPAPLLFGGVEPLMGKQKGLVGLLLAKKWKEAQAESKLQLIVAGGFVEKYPGLAATALALEALADAGAGDRGPALCRWHLAQKIDPKLASADLSAFGAAGELLHNAPAEPEPSTPAQDGVEAPVKVGDGVTRPEILRHSSPLYTETARKAKVEGTVIVEAIIDRDGSIKNVTILKGQPMGLSLSAMEAICGWRFKPATLKGEPVKVYYVLTVNFNVQKEPPPAISNP
jgi:TonB family protein